jgi:hypothetical protein
MRMLYESAEDEDASVGLLRLTTGLTGAREAKVITIPEPTRAPTDLRRCVAARGLMIHQSPLLYALIDMNNSISKKSKA